MDIAYRELVAEVEGSAVGYCERVNWCVGTVVVFHGVNVGLSLGFGYGVLPYVLDVAGWGVLWVVFEMEEHCSFCLCGFFVMAFVMVNGGCIQVCLCIQCRLVEEFLEGFAVVSPVV